MLQGQDSVLTLTRQRAVTNRDRACCLTGRPAVACRSSNSCSLSRRAAPRSRPRTAALASFVSRASLALKNNHRPDGLFLSQHANQKQPCAQKQEAR